MQYFSAYICIVDEALLGLHIGEGEVELGGLEPIGPQLQHGHDLGQSCLQIKEA